jgi:hypothetical protein
MSVAVPPTSALVVPGSPRTAFASGFVALAIGAAVLAGWFPIEFSIATVFLFAGPHNWFEARYALGRLPARAGKLWGFFTVSAIGIIGLAGAYAAVPAAMSLFSDSSLAVGLYSVWGTAFLLWVAALVWMRSRTNPRFDGGWVWPLALLICAGVWLNPFALPVVLVYLHPLMALWLLDRELARSRPHWRRTYWCILGCVPLLVGVLWWQLHNAPEPTGATNFSVAFAPRLANHAGAWFLDGVSPHFLIAAHAFLEMVHYGVWVVLIPLIGMRSRPWQLTTIPAARRNKKWSRGVAAVLLFGALIVVTLWVCFGLDYATTRHVYFTVAMLHVLAEVPFLLRMV